MSNKRASVVAIYEFDVDYLLPVALLQLVEEEGCNIATSEFYLDLIIQSEFGAGEYQTEHLPLSEEEVVSFYSKPKLIQQAFDVDHNFPEHVNLFVDEEYIMELEDQYWGDAS